MTLITENVQWDVERTRQLYLHLMKQCLTNSIYQDAEYQSISMRSGIRPLLRAILRRLGVDLVRKVDPSLRLEGQDCPKSAHTMVGQKRLDNIQYCVEKILEEVVPGDLIETGVWRGGSSILMRAILKAYGVTDRSVYVADSFEGLPLTIFKLGQSVKVRPSGFKKDFYTDCNGTIIAFVDHGDSQDYRVKFHVDTQKEIVKTIPAEYLIGI